MHIAKQLTSGYLSREQLVRVLNLTESKSKVSNLPSVLSRWLIALAAPAKTLRRDANLNISDVWSC